jgi:hypothetical protein
MMDEIKQLFANAGWEECPGNPDRPRPETLFRLFREDTLIEMSTSGSGKLWTVDIACQNGCGRRTTVNSDPATALRIALAVMTDLAGRNRHNGSEGLHDRLNGLAETLPLSLKEGI